MKLYHSRKDSYAGTYMHTYIHLYIYIYYSTFVRVVYLYVFRFFRFIVVIFYELKFLRIMLPIRNKEAPLFAFELPLSQTLPLYFLRLFNFWIYNAFDIIMSTCTNVIPHMQSDSKLLLGFPWPENGNNDNYLESLCIKLPERNTVLMVHDSNNKNVVITINIRNTTPFL
jgi:hypothetical protein